MDWFKGKFTGKPHDLNGTIYGFRLRFSPTNQSIEKTREEKRLENPQPHKECIAELFSKVSITQDLALPAPCFCFETEPWDDDEDDQS